MLRDAMMVFWSIKHIQENIDKKHRMYIHTRFIESNCKRPKILNYSNLLLINIFALFRVMCSFLYMLLHRQLINIYRSITVFDRPIRSIAYRALAISIIQKKTHTNNWGPYKSIDSHETCVHGCGIPTLKIKYDEFTRSRRDLGEFVSRAVEIDDPAIVVLCASKVMVQLYIYIPIPQRTCTYVYIYIH